MVKLHAWLLAFDVPPSPFPDEVRLRASLAVLGVLMLGVVTVACLLAYGWAVRRRLKRNRAEKTTPIADRWYAPSPGSSPADSSAKSDD